MALADQPAAAARPQPAVLLGVSAVLVIFFVLANTKVGLRSRVDIPVDIPQRLPPACYGPKLGSLDFNAGTPDTGCCRVATPSSWQDLFHTHAGVKDGTGVYGLPTHARLSAAVPTHGDRNATFAEWVAHNATLILVRCQGRITWTQEWDSVGHSMIQTTKAGAEHGVFVAVREDAEYVEVRCIHSNGNAKGPDPFPAGRSQMLLRNVQSLSPPPPPPSLTDHVGRPRGRQGNTTAQEERDATPGEHAPRVEDSAEDDGFEGVYHILVDSTSRLGLLQYLPKTVCAINKIGGQQHSLHVFNKYHSDGIWTDWNMQALLADCRIQDLERGSCSPDWIWNEFKKSGWATAFVEVTCLRTPELRYAGSLPSIGGSALHRGFCNDPKSLPGYILPGPALCNPFWERGQIKLDCGSKETTGHVLGADNSRYCVGVETTTGKSLRWIEELWENQKHRKRYTGTLLPEPHSGGHPVDDVLDELLSKHILRMVERHPNILIVFGADHGARDIAHNHPVFNVNLPPMMMLVPKALLSKNTGLADTLERNTREVTGTFDVFSTLKHLAQWSTHRNLSGHQTGSHQFGRHGQSLMTPLPVCRTCTQANVRFCQCLRPKVELANLAVVQHVAEAALLRLNHQWRLSAKTVCVPFKLRDIVTHKATEAMYGGEFGPAEAGLKRSVYYVQLTVSVESPARPANNPAIFSLATFVHFNGTRLDPDTPIKVRIEVATQQSKFRPYMTCSIDAGRGIDFREEHCMCKTPPAPSVKTP